VAPHDPVHRSRAEAKSQYDAIRPSACRSHISADATLAGEGQLFQASQSGFRALDALCRIPRDADCYERRPGDPTGQIGAGHFHRALMGRIRGTPTTFPRFKRAADRAYPRRQRHGTTMLGSILPVQVNVAMPSGGKPARSVRDAGYRASREIRRPVWPSAPTSPTPPPAKLPVPEHEDLDTLTIYAVMGWRGNLARWNHGRSSLGWRNATHYALRPPT
jgi:hypothetical protein